MTIAELRQPFLVEWQRREIRRRQWRALREVLTAMVVSVALAVAIGVLTLALALALVLGGRP